MKAPPRSGVRLVMNHQTEKPEFAEVVSTLHHGPWGGLVHQNRRGKVLMPTLFYQRQLYLSKL